MKSLLTTFLAGFAGGFAALLMPCIFPMLPMTAGFFTKQGRGIPYAMVYGLCIILIYVGLGLLVTVLFGASALNELSTNGLFNFGFFLLLLLFAASFLGGFELTLPSAWANRADARTDKGGLAGLFFMAATLAIVSFSCTGPIIGTLLVQAAATGDLLAPAAGMSGFSLALALPFTMFAAVPALLGRLPKSGGWLNSVKVVLGFLELALALKFLSNVDLAYHWRWLDREVFLVLWIVIFALLGLYLLGKLRFAYDSAPAFISVPRLFLAITVLSFTLYLVPGLWGAPLKAVSAFLPPLGTQDFNLLTREKMPGVVKPARKYAELFDAPAGLAPFFDYEEGIAFAKKVNKPVLIDFTGHACVNCRKMEATVWTDTEVHRLISEAYVLIQLYVDDRTALPGGTTLGRKWSTLQAERFVSNSQPFYVLLDPRTEKPLVPSQGAEYDAGVYAGYLLKGLRRFQQTP